MRIEEAPENWGNQKSKGEEFAALNFEETILTTNNCNM